ncbi:MAG: 2-oxo acid dehydrogenase subunit E2 [Buchnera aphidicola (Schlechtendalia peitan)]
MDIKVSVPDIGIDGVEVIEILIKIGDIVNKDDTLIIVEGEKASIEIPSKDSGVVKSILVKIGQTVKTGSLIVILTAIKNNNQSSQTKLVCIDNINSNVKVDNYNNFLFSKSSSNNKVLIHATPTIRRLARKLNINLEKITGSGRKGRIIKEDIISCTEKMLNNVQDHTDRSIVKDFFNNDSNVSKEIQELYLTKIQQASGKNLSKSWSIIPHVTQFEDSDITDLEKFRKEYNIGLNENSSNVRLTVLIFVIKVVAKSLRVFPKFNSVLYSNTKHKLILNKSINIGIAVNTKNGLLVPIINDVDKKDLSTLSIELSLLSKKAKSGHLSVKNTISSGFTISNLGGIGGTGFTPIINSPEVAILGMSKAVIKPQWNGKEFIPRLILPLSLSYDHRAIDGVEAVQFITSISKLLSDVRLLMI